MFYYFSFCHYFLLLLATIAQFFLLKIEISPNKNLVICGMKLRLQIRVIYWTKYLADTLFFCSCSLLLLLRFYILLSFFLPATRIASSMYEVTCACVCMYVSLCVMSWVQIFWSIFVPYISYVNLYAHFIISLF